MPRHQGELPAVGADVDYHAHLTEVAQHGGVFYPGHHPMAPQRTTPIWRGQNIHELAALGY